MKSRTSPVFREQPKNLPEEVRLQAKNAYKRFKMNPWYNSLHFKQVHPELPIYSVRISKGYRAVGRLDERGVLWFWIGSHDDYEKLLKQLR